MSSNSTFYSRLLSYAESQGIKNTSALAEALDYDKPERLYRLKRDENARPSFEVIEGVTNLFESLNVRWLITGKGDAELSSGPIEEANSVQEPESIYLTKSQEQKKLLKEKERVISQQQETITALNEAYGQLKLRFADFQGGK